MNVLESLGINPAFAAVSMLWVLTFGIALSELIRYHRRTIGKPVWFWLIVIFLVPAGQFLAIVYFYRARRRE